jgi:hypothetical protein
MDNIANAIDYEYQVLRYRHDPVSGEFVNIGIVFLDVKNRKLQARVTEKYSRISHFFGHVSGPFLMKTIKHIEREFNKIGKQLKTELSFNTVKSVSDISSSVLPINDNGLFFSEVMHGWHINFESAFEATFDRLVGKYTAEKIEQRHDDSYAWKHIYKKYFDEQGITQGLKEHTVKTDNDVIEFDHAAKNGVWHCVQPISFDLVKTGDIKDKIYRWAGMLNELKTADEPLHIYLLSLMPDNPQLQAMIEQKLNIQQTDLTVQVVKEHEAQNVAKALKEKLDHA